MITTQGWQHSKVAKLLDIGLFIEMINFEHMFSGIVKYKDTITYRVGSLINGSNDLSKVESLFIWRKSLIENICLKIYTHI